MCLSRKDAKDVMISVGESSNKAKYEFLKMYYTKWNQITNPSPRAIIDTHAGSGIVRLIQKGSIINDISQKKIYGSPLLAMLKTLTISQKLILIFNEADSNRFEMLKGYVNDFIEKGIPIFEEKSQEFRYKSLETKRKRRLRNRRRVKREYPDEIEVKPPLGFEEKRLKTKADIFLYNKKIENSIEDIIANHLEKIDGDSQQKPKSLFLVDPCGAVSWEKVILKICERANKQEGTELILNWSWEAINRNLNTNQKETTLSKIYGISQEDVTSTFEKNASMYDYLNAYIRKLSEYFEYIVDLGVPRDRKIKPRQSDYRKYFLLFCTNNESGVSLAGYKKKDIKIRMRKGYGDLVEIAKNLPESD